MRTIAIANQKGGCGKTTVAINLSASLARESRRTLLIDLDPQAHCALGVAVPEEQIDLSILDCMLGQIDGEPVELSRITWQIAPNLDMAPSRSNLAGLEPRLGTQDNGDTLLRGLLEANAGRYDYCVIDCPPHLGLLMRNGLRAANDVVIPVDTGYFSLYGLTQQLATIEHLGDRNGAKPTVRVLPNQYDVRTKLGREILAELRKRFQGVVYETIINFNTKLKEGASFGQPITEFAPNSMGARDFQKLAREVIAGESASTPTADLIQHVEKLTADAERLLATTTVLVGKRTDRTVDRISAGQVPARQKSPAGSARQVAAAEVSRSSKTSAPVASSAGARRTLLGQDSVGTPSRTPTPKTRSVKAADPESSQALAQTARQPATPAPPTPAPRRQETSRAMPKSDSPSKPLAADFSTLIQDATPVSDSVAHAEISRRIETVYGVRQDGDVVIFRSHSPKASEVQLAGDFNDWMPHTTPMRRLADGDFEARLRLPKGRYRYRLVVDGRWSHDRKNPAVETNAYGELNSIVEVTK